MRLKAELPRREHVERVVDSFSSDTFENLAAIGGKVELTDNDNRGYERSARATEAVDPWSEELLARNALRS